MQRSNGLLRIVGYYVNNCDPLFP